jgi:hypothetical protein
MELELTLAEMQVAEDGDRKLLVGAKSDSRVVESATLTELQQRGGTRCRCCKPDDVFPLHDDCQDKPSEEGDYDQ